MNYQQMLEVDFHSDKFHEILEDPNHIIRRLFCCYIEGDYGFDIYDINIKKWKQATTLKKKRSFVISAFLHAQSLDYGCTTQQVQRWLMKNVGIERLEKLNQELINDVTDSLKEVA